MKCLLYGRQFFLCLLPLLFASCCFFPLCEDVEFLLPEKSQWKIYVSSGGEFTVDGDSFSISTVKNEPLAVVARSLSSGKSAGAIYPYNHNVEERYSFPAQVLYSLVFASVNSESEKMYCLSTFNWKRFEDDCSEMGENIWKVNKEIIMRKIAAGTFRKSDLKIEKTN